MNRIIKGNQPLLAAALQQHWDTVCGFVSDAKPLLAALLRRVEPWDVREGDIALVLREPTDDAALEGMQRNQRRIASVLSDIVGVSLTVSAYRRRPKTRWFAAPYESQRFEERRVNFPLKGAN